MVRSLFLLLFISSCTIMPRDRLEVDSNFTTEEQINIIQAVETWEYWCKIDIEINIQNVGNNCGYNQMCRRGYNKEDENLALTSQISGGIRIFVKEIETVNQDYHELFYQTVLHELGHWISGRGHIETDGIMSEYDTKGEITRADISWVCS